MMGTSWLGLMMMVTIMVMGIGVSSSRVEISVHPPELSKPSTACQDIGPPYLLVTFHDAPRNVAKFTLDGCLMGLVLIDNPSLTSDTQFRGMAIHDDGLLFIAQTAGADDMRSSVSIYSACNASSDPVNNRQFLAYAVTTKLNPGLVHPYGVALESRSNPYDPHVLYVTSQHTDNAIRYFPQLETLYQPMPFPQSIVNSPAAKDMYYGTFVQYGAPGVHASSEQGIRGVALVPSAPGSSINYVWIANEDLNEIEIFSSVNGTKVVEFGTGSEWQPVSVYYDPLSTLVFVGCSPSSGSGDGIIFVVDPFTVRTTSTLSTSSMNHPAGMVALDGVLYVLEQENDHLLTFSIASSTFLGTLVKSFADLGFSQPEQLELTDC